MKTHDALRAVQLELLRAQARFEPFASTHEGFALIHEEVDELWDAVKSNESPERLAAEAIQVAAMALRFITDLEGMTDKRR